MRRILAVILITTCLLTLVSCSGFWVKFGSRSSNSDDDGGGGIGDSPYVVARWQFENDWVDSVGGNNGTAVLGTTPAFTADKLLGANAADLSAPDSQVEIGNSSALTPSKLTVSFWLKRTGAASPSANVLLWAKPCTWNDPDGFYISRETPGKAITLIVSGGNLIGVNDDPDVVFALNMWSHVAVTFDSTTSEGHIYINGVDQPLTTIGTPTTINPAVGTPKYIGSCSNGSSIDWPMDELMIYNGVLSATQVQDLYQAQKTAAGI